MKLTTTLRVICLLIMGSWLTGTAIAQTRPSSERADALILNTELVSITVSVTDQQGRYFTGLDRNSFSIFEDGIAQEIAFFGVDDGPASIGIVFDHSGSMKGERNNRAKEALARLIQSGHPQDEYSLVAFSDRIHTVMERVYDGEVLTRAVDNTSSQGNTILFDAVAKAVDLVKKGRWAKRALIIISDGEDNQSRITLRKLRQQLSESGVTVYAVITEASNLPRVWGAEDLRSLSAYTGGMAHSPENIDQVDAAFDRIALEMRQRYSVGYLPTSIRDDRKWRSLKVKLAPPPGAPKLSVRSKAGYYPIPGFEQSGKEALDDGND